MTHFKLITACFMVLSIIAQSVNAVSAPCPKLASASTSSPASTKQSDVTSPCHNMLTTTQISQPSDTNYTNDEQSCCGESACPMNYSVVCAVFIMPELIDIPNALMAYSKSYSNQYLSAPLPHLYRPPIFL